MRAYRGVCLRLMVGEQNNVLAGCQLLLDPVEAVSVTKNLHIARVGQRTHRVAGPSADACQRMTSGVAWKSCNQCEAG